MRHLTVGLIEETLQVIETEIQYLELQKRRLQSKGVFFTPMKIAKLDEKLNDLRRTRISLKDIMGADGDKPLFICDNEEKD